MKHVWTRTEQEEELDTPCSNMTRSHFLGVVSTRVQAFVTSYMRATVAQSDRERFIHRLYFWMRGHISHFRNVFLGEVYFVNHLLELRFISWSKRMFEMCKKDGMGVWIRNTA